VVKGKFLGEFEQLVLLAVARLKGQGYGMSIRREIEARTGRDVSIGAVYATLDRLESKGYLTSSDGEALPVRGGRRRRHFALRPAGAQELRHSRRMFERMWADIDLEDGWEPV
jgi:PadR family transcriptional regulator PadR